LVKTQHKTQLLDSVYRTFYLAKVVTFETRNGPSTHVIDATSFVKTCQQEKKEEAISYISAIKRWQRTKIRKHIKLVQSSQKQWWRICHHSG
jgi:predicted GIY-YIG superfamily endonuclease